MSTPIFCLARRPLHDTALRQALRVDSQPMKPLEAAHPATTLAHCPHCLTRNLTARSSQNILLPLSILEGSRVYC